MVNYLTLDGSIRKDLGSANTRRLRKEGKIPAVIYGVNGAENTFISISKKDFDKEYLKSNIELRPIELNVDGKKFKVLTYQIDLDPITDLPRHVDFNNLEGKKEAKIYVPVNYLGREKSPGVKKGGFLNILKRKIECLCPIDNILQCIDIDVSKMHIGSKIRSTDVTLPNGIKFTNKKVFDICSVTGRGKSTDDVAAPATTTDAAAPAAATTAAPAADAKAPAAAKTEAKK